MADLLITYGANIEQKNSWGASPLRLAVRAGAQDVVEILLHAGANANAHDEDGKTPLDEASLQKNWEMIKLLKRPRAEHAEAQIIEKDNSLSLLNDLFKALNKKELKIERYEQAIQRFNKTIKLEGERYLTGEELELRSKVLQEVQTKLGFQYQPDGQNRIKRNDEAMRVLGAWGNTYTAAEEIVSKSRFLSFNSVLQLDRMIRQQDLVNDVHWLTPEDKPLLVIFISHRWENRFTPDPHGTQLRTCKAVDRKLH